jgi:hypothetical protein
MGRHVYHARSKGNDSIRSYRHIERSVGFDGHAGRRRNGCNYEFGTRMLPAKRSEHECNELQGECGEFLRRAGGQHDSHALLSPSIQCVGEITTVPVGYTTGIAFCFTGGGSSTDNTNAATGVYLTLYYK